MKGNVFSLHKERYPLHYIFIQEGTEVNCPTAKDPIELCSMLVEAMNGKNVDKQDIFGATPLHYAAFCGATICCLLLLNKGADINRKDKAGNTPLAYSVMAKHDSCALMLMQKGADVNIKVHKAAYTKMHQEAEKDANDKSNRKLDKDKAHFRFLPRHFASSTSEDDTFTLFQGLVQNDWLGLTYVAMEKMEGFGMSYAKAIEVAFHLNKLQFAKRLIEKQVSEAKLQAKVNAGRSLINACAFEISNRSENLLMQDVLDLLMNVGLSLTTPDNHGCTPLHYACLNRHFNLIKYIFDKLGGEDFKRNVNQRDKFGRTPLAASFWLYAPHHCEQKEILKYLLDKGASPNIQAKLKIMSYLQHGFTNRSAHVHYLDNLDDNANVATTTPLSVLLIHQDKDDIKMLLGYK